MRTTALFCVPIWLASCGGTSHDDEPPHGVAAQGSSAAGAGGGGSAAGSGGVGGAGNGGRGGSSGTAGSSAAAGMSAGGRSGTGGGNGGDGAMSSGTSGEAGSGGSGGMLVEGAGFICQSPNRCDIGERCVSCTTSGGTKYLCAPNPDEDPSGFAAAIEGCDPGAGDHYAECDGPEDCPRDRYCVWGHDPMAAYGGNCITEAELPNPLQASCCWVCDAQPLCVLCNTEDDCPETLLCVESIGAPNGVNGCRVPD